MSRAVKRALLVLFAMAVLLGGAGLLGGVLGYEAAQAAQASQRRQGAVLEERLCTSLNRLAALDPPAGPVADNPSRAYLQQLHQVLAELGPDVACPSSQVPNVEVPSRKARL